MLLSRITVAISLIILIHYVDGNQRIEHVSELISDEDFFASCCHDGNNSLTCCVYGKCSCHSFHHALANLTSNVLINITTNVMLSSLIETSGLKNVSIIGHNNPTVNCKNVGGMYFTICRNFIIQGITWDGCGNENIDDNTEPGLKLNYSSNITIQNCSFQHSIREAVVLLEVLDVSIRKCKFVNNCHYSGHGVAIHYSSSNTTNHSQLVFTINNCNFTQNKCAKGVIYIGQSEKRKPEHNKNMTIFFYNSIFYDNQGVSVYAVNQWFSLNGKVLFQNNKANKGAGIYISDHSTVIFGENSDIASINNTADYGGAIFSYYGDVTFKEHSIATFSNNIAHGYGGAIHSSSHSNVSFIEYSIATFSNLVIILLDLEELYLLKKAIYYLKNILLQNLVIILLIVMVEQCTLIGIVIYHLKKILLQHL